MRTAAIPLLLFLAAIAAMPAPDREASPYPYVQPSTEHLAVAFYCMTDGADSPATLGSYSTAELIVNR